MTDKELIKEIYDEVVKKSNKVQEYIMFNRDFTIADRDGMKAILHAYEKAFDSWKNNYKYLTWLVIVLNHKNFEHGLKGNTVLQVVYGELFNEAFEYAYTHLEGKELDYFLEVTD